MAFKHVVLAVVQEVQAHGYEIHVRLAQTLPMSRACEKSRVYTVLVGLQRDGLVAISFEDAGRGRSRKIYRLTRDGAAELERWARRPRPGASLLRRNLLLQMAFLPRLAPPGSTPDWGAAIGRRTRLRDGLRRRGANETRMERLIRMRVLAHIEAELRVVRGLVDRPVRPVRRCSSSPSPFPDRSSASR